MSARDGGPAFPVEAPHSFAPGMSLRDWFAGMAMQGLIESPNWTFDSARDPSSASIKDLTKEAYRVADAMLKVRT